TVVLEAGTHEPTVHLHRRHISAHQPRRPLLEWMGSTQARSPTKCGRCIFQATGFNGVAEFTRRRGGEAPHPERFRSTLQWGRRVHSAKSWIPDDAPGSWYSLLQWVRRVLSAKRHATKSWQLAAGLASMGSPSSLGEERHRAPSTSSRTTRFNGVAEFTRRRA